MPSQNLRAQVARTMAAAPAVLRLLEKRGSRFASAFSAAAAAAKPAATAAAKPISRWLGYGAKGALGVGGLYGTGLVGYHGLGIGKPVDHSGKFNTASGQLQSLHGQYEQDIRDTQAGTYNPMTGGRADSWYSRIFGFEGLSPAERAQQVKAMQDKLTAAQKGTGTLGGYRGRNGWLYTSPDWYGSTYQTLRDKALQHAQQGVNQRDFSPGVLNAMMLDGGGTRQIDDGARTAMQEFIKAYGPQTTQTPSASARYSYIGARPPGPVNYAQFGPANYGIDYSGFYQPPGAAR